MGRYDSSLTRVQPVLNELLIRRSIAEWLPDLWSMAVSTRQGEPEPLFAGEPLLNDKIYERAFPPSRAFLRWMVQNPEKLTPPAGPPLRGRPRRSGERQAQRSIRHRP